MHGGDAETAGPVPTTSSSPASARTLLRSCDCRCLSFTLASFSSVDRASGLPDDENFPGRHMMVSAARSWLRGKSVFLRHWIRQSTASSRYMLIFLGSTKRSSWRSSPATTGLCSGGADCRCTRSACIMLKDPPSLIVRRTRSAADRLNNGGRTDIKLSILHQCKLRKNMSCILGTEGMFTF